MSFSAPVSDHLFLLSNVVGLNRVTETERYSGMTPDLVKAVLTEAGKMCDDVIAPLQRAGDLHPALLENGVVRSTPGFAEAYREIASGGWVGMAATPENGGMGLPMAVATSVNEMMSGACLSLQLNPLMTQGQIDALEHHASDAIKALFLPKLISGEWSGTMNLTEPQAGSDVGALAAKASAAGDGTYNISGQKIYISWGDTDFTENVCHLVLARLPGAEPGTKGISLFLVPKRIPDETGKPGIANSLKVVSLEHKMGLHGSPTAVMQYDSAKGWLVGEPHDGMRAMFTMMNNARLGVGVQGIGVAEAAFQHALAYALDRKQGRPPVAGTGAIIDHADVRRMLMTMKAEVFAARAIALSNAVATDLSRATGDAMAKARAALLTPITKAYGTETGVSVANLGIQVHGGMGFIEETGAAQFLRDVRVTAIYEGTNGIQAMDLVGRKLADDGDAMFRLLDEIEAGAERGRTALPDLAEPVWQASETLRETTEALVRHDRMNARFAGAVPYLMCAARILGGHFHLTAAMAEGGKGSRTGLARFFVQRLLPEHTSLAAQAVAGEKALYALSPEEFCA
ncbi:acyl-CoA dehydrogenase [Tropicimonas sp. S265A]|uniref:acyl-CoA dehydrogenase n=1 Tax=Tropicimonas sp. S265A TaxID=3415134 RepID=UPI003C7E51A8